MKHDSVAEGLCDDCSLAEPPATPTRSSPSFSLPRRARERVVDSTPIRFPITHIQNRSGKPPQPTQRQTRALRTLAKFNPGKVAAWVEILQSLTPGYKHIGGLAPLTPPELSAVHELKNCEEEWLLTWLKVAAPCEVKRPSSTPQISPSQSITDHRGYSRALQPALSTPTHTSASPLPPSSAFSLRTIQSTVPSTLSNATSYSEPSTIDQGSPTSSKTDAHLHWCHICKRLRAIQKCDSYKRHMREHETVNQCMPHGPVKSTKTGTECLFCGASNPNQAHLDAHSVSKCSGQFAKRQSYTRRVNLSKHIKEVHNASEHYAFSLASAWVDPHKNKRRFFSCGFCVCYFDTLIKASNHIDLEHWRQHQELKKWDNNKVILGLLLQPDVKEVWQQLLVSAGVDPEFDPLHNPAPQWHPSVVEHVQLQLETREISAPALAKLAFDKSSYHSIHQANIINSTLQPRNQDVDMFGHLPIEQITIDTTQLPNEEFLQIPDNSSRIDNHHPFGHGHRDNSYHGNALGHAHSLPEIQSERLLSTTGVYEAIAFDLHQVTGYDSNPFDLNQSGGTMDDMIESEALSSTPWSTYTALQRPDLGQDPILSDLQGDVQASFHSNPSVAHVDIASDNSTDQPESYLQRYDSTVMERLAPSVNKTTPVIHNRLPARGRYGRPIVTGGSKRKPSSSPPRDSNWNREANPLIVEMGRASVHDDRFRSKKRIEGYNN